MQYDQLYTLLYVKNTKHFNYFIFWSDRVNISGDNLQIVSRVRKLLKSSLAPENFLKIQFKSNKPKKKGHFLLEYKKSSLLYSNAKLAWIRVCIYNI